ncbi:hypothetical protein DIZ76_012746 [Coccidioides immitis]|nr:hypothetical protein CIRG_02696 [Coccidioides immitis RMSCC 2394]KMU73548.1 hypothetical protein CISG_10090 [Coccidioides immitis RMSCC 3703]TPX23415.1 hypothetical protein DIZ76_012746 [Coccidioides immitis]
MTMSEGGDDAPPRLESLQRARSWIPSVPAPIKRVFDKFPLKTYPANAIPSRSLPDSSEHRLYVFSNARGCKQSAPSHNPQCLKWQAYLKFSGIRFRIISSNNHASPTGSLPFLLPGAQSSGSSEALNPIPSNKLQRWTVEQLGIKEEEPTDMRFDAYSSLLDHRLRNAWLYTLYLDPLNFSSVARKLYVNPFTANFLVRMAIATELQDAARKELLKRSPYIDVDDLMAEANNAFESLSILLGSNLFFFNRETPGLFDASVFAYTHLILDEKLGWKHNPLEMHLRRYDNLVKHRQRLLEAYF